MKVVRHGRPHPKYLATLRKPKRADYEKLVKACLEALIQGQIDVIIAFPYVMKFPKDFPRGILERKVDDANIHRIKAKKLLDWLRSRGYTDITTDMLRARQISLTKFMQRIGEGLFDTEI